MNIIEKIENKAIRGTLSDEEKKLRINLRVKVNEMELRKAKDLQQKSRVNWLKFGDENSSFLNKSISINSASNRINGLVFKNSMVSDPEEIRDWFKKIVR